MKNKLSMINALLARSSTKIPSIFQLIVFLFHICHIKAPIKPILATQAYFKPTLSPIFEVATWCDCIGKWAPLNLIFLCYVEAVLAACNLASISIVPLQTTGTAECRRGGHQEQCMEGLPGRGQGLRRAHLHRPGRSQETPCEMMYCKLAVCACPCFQGCWPGNELIK